MKRNVLNEQILFYHGTTEQSAKMIISRGIHLRTDLSRPGDFGYGFYVTEDFPTALQHAENRCLRTHGQERPACLVFTIGKNEFHAHEIRKLTYHEQPEEIPTE